MDETKRALDGIKLVISMLQNADPTRFKDLIETMQLAAKLLSALPSELKVPEPAALPVRVEQVGLDTKKSFGGKVSPAR